jgi:hypothetical protein
VHTSNRRKTARLKASLKAKRTKERLRKAGRLLKGSPNSKKPRRLTKRVRRT